MIGQAARKDREGASHTIRNESVEGRACYIPTLVYKKKWIKSITRGWDCDGGCRNYAERFRAKEDYAKAEAIGTSESILCLKLSVEVFTRVHTHAYSCIHQPIHCNVKKSINKIINYVAIYCIWWNRKQCKHWQSVIYMYDTMNLNMINIYLHS